MKQENVRGLISSPPPPSNAMDRVNTSRLQDPFFVLLLFPGGPVLS